MVFWYRHGRGMQMDPASADVTISGVSLSVSTLSLTLSTAADVDWEISANLDGSSPTLTGSFSAGAGTTDEPIDISSLGVGDWYIRLTATTGASSDSAGPVGFHVTPRVTIDAITPSPSGASVDWSTTGDDGSAWILASTDDTLDATDVEAGGAEVSVTAEGAQTPAAISGLTAATDYIVYILRKDASGAYSALATDGFTTSAAPSLAYVQGLAYSDRDYNTTINVTMPATVTAGNLLLAVIAVGDVRTMSAAPSGWSLVGSFDHEGATGTTFLYTKNASGSEGGTTPQWTASAACKYVATVHEISGSSGNVEWATGTTYDPPSITPTGGSLARIWLAHVATPYTGFWTVTGAPSGYSGLVTYASDSGNNASSAEVTAATAYKSATASSEDPGTFTFSSTPDATNRSSATIAVW